MTRKDYILIAEALQIQFKIDRVGLRSDVVFSCAKQLAGALKSDNPRFDTDHFLAVVRGERDLNSRPGRR